MSEVSLKISAINQMKHMEFMDDSAIKAAFITMNMKVRGVSETEAEMFYNREAMYLKRILFDSTKTGNDKDSLLKCTMFSLYSCLMDIAVNGLSFERAANLCYIERRNYNVGKNENGVDIWESRASLKVSPYGELALRMELGQIKYADTPVIVFEGEPFRIKYVNGQKIVEWECIIPRKSKKIVGSFVKLTRPDGSLDFPYLGQEEIARLEQFSQKQNKGKASYLYGNKNEDGVNISGIDSGFLAAKTIKHAFKAYPKVLIKGTNTALEDYDETDLDLPAPGSQMQEKPELIQTSGPVYTPNNNDFVANNGNEDKGIIQQQEEDDIF